MQLDSYVCGGWRAVRGEGTAMRDATTGQVIAQATTEGFDFRAVLDHARQVGGPALRRMTFHERATCLKNLAKYLSERKAEFYDLSFATGATKNDSMIDIDGGFGTLFVYASKGTRELPNSHVYVEGPVEALSKGGTFIGQHICAPLEGAAVHINGSTFRRGVLQLSHAARRRARSRSPRRRRRTDRARVPAHRLIRILPGAVPVV
jgi:oxepin-CoA hydrolase/3-oxo-5,6-dehydrosuberyl-CoA semialdehyde dehydrogenase